MFGHWSKIGAGGTIAPGMPRRPDPASPRGVAGVEGVAFLQGARPGGPRRRNQKRGTLPKKNWKGMWLRVAHEPSLWRAPGNAKWSTSRPNW